MLYLCGIGRWKLWKRYHFKHYWGRGKWDKETVHLLYDQDREKTEYSALRNRCNERHHQNLMPRHLLDDEDQFLFFFSWYDKNSNKMRVKCSQRWWHKVLIFMIKCPVTPYDTLAVIVRLHMTLYTIYLKIKIQSYWIFFIEQAISITWL
jgi:hypothetical protein